MNGSADMEGRHEAAANAPSALPRSLERALDRIALGDQFFDAVTRAADQAGCEMLFEIPAVLLGRNGDRAAAIACGPEQELFFVVFDGAEGAIAVIEAGEVPVTVIDFTRSYAGVLGMIASDRDVVSPLLQ